MKRAALIAVVVALRTQSLQAATADCGRTTNQIRVRAQGLELPQVSKKASILQVAFIWKKPSENYLFEMNYANTAGEALQPQAINRTPKRPRTTYMNRSP